MKDLTKGSIVTHLLSMAAPVVLGMVAQIAYQLIDLYFLAQNGVAAVAGASASANIVFAVTALTTALGVGTTSLVAHAAGRKDREEANLIFAQCVALSVVTGLAMMVLLYALTHPYLNAVAADEQTIAAGATFLFWALPGYALLFPMTIFGSALRGVGVAAVASAIYMSSVVCNAILAPILIAGYGTGMPLGVLGAGLATTLSICVGTLLFLWQFRKQASYLRLRPELMRPDLQQWRRILAIGLPAGGEFVLLFLTTAVVYYAIRDLGASAQAGFGIGWRLLQAVLLPSLAIAYSAGPIAAQNFGARQAARVRETFRITALIATAFAIVTMIVVQWRPQALVSLFGVDDAAIAVAAVFLQLMSWSFVAQGLAYTCATMFRGLGHTMPALVSAAARFITFTMPAIWLSTQPGFHITRVWHLLIASVVLQAVVSLCFLQVEFRRRLNFGAVHLQADPS